VTINCNVVWCFFSLVYFISAVASPICGFGIDRVGRNIFWLLVGVIVTLICHGVMAFTFLTPFVPMVDNCLLTYEYSVMNRSMVTPICCDCCKGVRCPTLFYNCGGRLFHEALCDKMCIFVFLLFYFYYFIVLSIS